MHTWGDDFPYWDDLHLAIRRIIWINYRYGLFGYRGKEKYGTFRDEISRLWDGTLQGLMYPGHYYIRGSYTFYSKIDEPIISRITKYTGIRYLVRKYQAAVYNYAIQSTVKMYPHLKDELTVMIDGYEMVRPGIFGPLDGKAIHRANWK